MEFAGVIAVLGGMSLAVERVVELIKNSVPYLTREDTDPDKERSRRMLIQLLAACIGVVVAFIAKTEIQDLLSGIRLGTAGCVLLGIVASGGSGFWNQLLRIAEETKKSRKIQTQKLSS